MPREAVLPSPSHSEAVRDELLEMRAEDVRVRAQLAATGELFDGYNPTMEAVHLHNAARLEQLLSENNLEWFSQSMVGEDGAEAAWIILQHAISATVSLGGEQEVLSFDTRA